MAGKRKKLEPGYVHLRERISRKVWRKKLSYRNNTYIFIACAGNWRNLHRKYLEYDEAIIVGSDKAVPANPYDVLEDSGQYALYTRKRF